MVRRSTWIVLIIFAVLAIFAWLFQRYQDNKVVDTPTATPTTPPTYLYNISSQNVTEITISDQSGNSISLYQDPLLSKWAIADVPSDQVDSFQVESVTAQLFSLQAQDVLTQTPSLDSVGLATPEFTITITNTDKKIIKTYIGIETAIGSGYYARVDTGPVVILDKVVMDNILDLLKNPPLLTTPTPEMTTTSTATPIEFENQATPTP